MIKRTPKLTGEGIAKLRDQAPTSNIDSLLAETKIPRIIIPTGLTPPGIMIILRKRRNIKNPEPDSKDGDTNIIWGFAYIDAIWPPRAQRQWFTYGGLPIRRLELGLIAIGWGQIHELCSCDP